MRVVGAAESSWPEKINGYDIRFVGCALWRGEAIVQTEFSSNVHIARPN